MTASASAPRARLAADNPTWIEDYALIGNTRTAALVSRTGSIDWWCVPRFDSAACFAALLGAPEHGRWLIAPMHEVKRTARRYRPGTLVLETDLHTAEGSVRLIDCMPLREGRMDIVRIVEGVRGAVPMRFELVMRFGYGSVVPWVRREGHTLTATAGPDTLELRTPVAVRGKDYTTQAHFTVHEGVRIPFVLTHSASHEPRPVPLDAEAALEASERWWHAWSAQCTYQGNYVQPVQESLIVLKALTYAPTGGMVAAPTTSLPERIGGVRNWDYRFCWVRDATFTLYALLLAGYRDEARAWREWLLRAAAGRPQDLQVLYGVMGERVHFELTLPWLPGYAHSAPVRLGNAAATQRQLDVYGEVVDTLCLARRAGLAIDADAWGFQRVLLDYLESNWRQPDSGIWEMRGDLQHFTHSRMMAWVAMDRSIRDVERLRLDGPVDRWRKTRAAIHAEVCRARIRPQARDLRAALRLARPGREPVADAHRRVPAADRFTRTCDGEGDPARAQRGRLRAALPHRGNAGRPACRRRRVSALLVLDGRRTLVDRAQASGAHAVRAAAGFAQRRRAARRGIRSAGAAHARQFPAGAHARRIGEQRPQSRIGWRAFRAPQPRHGRTPARHDAIKFPPGNDARRQRAGRPGAACAPR